MERILHVIGSLNNGGSQSLVMNIYRNIDRSKLQFDFIISREDELFYADEIKQLGGRIYVLPTLNIKNITTYKKKWNDFFKKHSEYNIVHAHVRSTASIYLKIAKKYGLTTIAHSHSTSSGHGFSAVVKNIMQYNIRYISDYFLACSKDSAKWLFGENILNNDKFFLLNNSIDAQKFIYNEDKRNELRKKLNIENKFVIGHIGRFHHSKNHDFLIDIFYSIYKKNNNSVLLLIGDGELKPYIEKKVKLLQIEKNVIFLGVRENISDLLQAMDVFLFPSIYEGLGIAAIESQAAGLPTVISDAIPNEVSITSLVEVIELNNEANIWADRVLKYNLKSERISTYKEICKSGYDIKNTVEWIEGFYIKECKL